MPREYVQTVVGPRVAAEAARRLMGRGRGRGRTGVRNNLVHKHDRRVLLESICVSF
ncbi:hypothetical protein Syun_019585 [Stephania yunnanensis]|uniref:Uncharacterized protein n=1 Tax=Stephania yunnanensis TaxID=152371 RepID=A0AAP0IW29_9MAGN